MHDIKNHLIASVLIRNEEGKILAVRINKELKEGVWLPPGGKIELGETARECAVRECKEEVGVDVKLGNLVGVSEIDYGNNDVWTFLYFEAEIIAGTPSPQELDQNKTLEVLYLPLDQLHHSDKIRWIK